MMRLFLLVLLGFVFCSRGETRSELEAQANKGISEAQYKLSKILFKEQKIQQAVDWLKKAAANNHIKAMRSLGIHFEDKKRISSCP